MGLLRASQMYRIMASPPRLCATRRPTKAVTPPASSESRPAALPRQRGEPAELAAGRDRRAAPICRCGIRRSYPDGRPLAPRGQVEKPRSVRPNKELMIAMNPAGRSAKHSREAPQAQRSRRWSHMKFASIMTDMDIHQTWTSSSAAQQELTGGGREAQAYLAPVRALFPALIDGVRGRSGKLITTAEASGLIPTQRASRP